MMRKFISPIGCLLVALSACQSEPHFTVEGTISEAKGETLYLEASGIDEVSVLDSVKLGESGSYKFKSARPEAPEYYRLRINDQIINFSIDSTECITIDAPAAEMATQYTVSGSESTEKIKELTLKQMKLQQQVDALLKASSSLAPADVQDSLYRMVDTYKQEVKRQYIFKEPYKPYAYFALFQKLGSYLIFDPLNSREDIKCFQAVATSWNNDFPHSVRAKNLYNIVMRGLKNTRAPQQKVVELPADKIREADLIDIELKDLHGNVRTLTELKGKVVLLDFTVYENAASATRNLALREVYDKYHAQGFEIYQISLDADEHFWKTSADNLPWVCVRDAAGIYSNYLGIYAVNSLPSFFLINRNNVLTARGETVKDLDEAIKKLL
jgi:peroxiredoxin